MEEIVSKNKCTGCTACKNICPKNAISMKVGYDGFLYPEIDQSKCINCGLCKKTCPVINTKSNESINKCYVGYAKDEDIRFNSSSGGIFTLLANYVLDNNGIVIGAAFDENNKLNHIAITNKEGLEKLRGSKYLQSGLNEIFSFVKDTVKTNKVLFVGTPCQVAGLKAFIKNDYNNLICVDIICHGTPSPKLFDKYVKELESKNGKLLNYNFRDNSTGWDSYSNTMKYEDKKVSERNNENKYMRLFLSNIALRQSCYNCNFKLGNKYSDITLGDFWGVKNYYPEMYNDKGVSCIIINTKLGTELFDNIKNICEYKECKLEEIVLGNPSIKEPCKLPQKREEFFSEIDNYSINDLTNKYVKKSSIIKRIYRKSKDAIKRVIKK